MSDWRNILIALTIALAMGLAIWQFVWPLGQELVCSNWAIRESVFAGSSQTTKVCYDQS